MIQQHSYSYAEPDVIEPQKVCYFNRGSAGGDGRIVGLWVGANIYEWVFDSYVWYTNATTGVPTNAMRNTVTGQDVPESEAALIRAKYTVGELKEDDNPAIKVYAICEYV